VEAILCALILELNKTTLIKRNNNKYNIIFYLNSETNISTPFSHTIFDKTHMSGTPTRQQVVKASKTKNFPYRDEKAKDDKNLILMNREILVMRT